MVTIAEVIADCIDDEAYINNKEDMKEVVKYICKKFPLYKED